MTTLAFILFELLSLDGLAAISCLLSVFHTVTYIFVRLYGSVENGDNVFCIKIWRLLFSYFISCFSLMILVAVLCRHHNISTS